MTSGGSIGGGGAFGSDFNLKDPEILDGAANGQKAVKEDGEDQEGKKAANRNSGDSAWKSFLDKYGSNGKGVRSIWKV